jgi:hypothetical protein
VTRGRYIVTGDAHDLLGWTPETLAAALAPRLGEIGIEVVTAPRQWGGGGLDHDDVDPVLASTVQNIVETTILEG